MPTVPDAVKQEVEAKAAALIENVLSLAHLYPRPNDWRWSYPIALYTK
jgi:hypothetical protein